jgi:hypothetical protein
MIVKSADVDGDGVVTLEDFPLLLPYYSLITPLLHSYYTLITP